MSPLALCGVSTHKANGLSEHTFLSLPFVEHFFDIRIIPLSLGKRVSPASFASLFYMDTLTYACVLKVLSNEYSWPICKRGHCCHHKLTRPFRYITLFLKRQDYLTAPFPFGDILFSPLFCLYQIQELMLDCRLVYV